MTGIPTRFGPDGRRLYGVHQPAVGRGRGGLAAVICNPWGSEALRAHRSLRVLADTLSRAGWHVLRFDYFGTGDADGALSEGTVTGFRDDARQAAAELRALSGASQVVYVGLRLGASVAALAAQGDAAAAGLVLWDPVSSGRAWLEDTVGVAAAVASGDVESDGALLTAAFRDELRAMTADRLVGAGGPAFDRVLALTTTPTPGQADLRRLLAARSQFLRWETLDAPVAWLEHGFFGPGPIAAPVIQRIAAWGGR
jgi:alpha/beta superfamily hydrolase